MEAANLFFSNNLIFMDGEFTSLDIRTGELLSVGLVAQDKRQLYLEIEYTGEVHPWVAQKVLPQLHGKTVSKDEARTRIDEFFSHYPKNPYLVAYVNQFDAVYWYELFASTKEHPAFWIPIDFASILFAYGFDPESMNKQSFFDMLGVDKSVYSHHNALDDALLLKEIFYAFFNYLLRIGVARVEKKGTGR